MSKRALFLDRDGILNEVVRRGTVISSPRVVEEWRFVEDSVALVESARQRGFATVVVTNQPDVGRGKMSLETLERLHQMLRSRLTLDAIEVCCSGDDADRRRKPNAGMLLDAAAALGLDLQRSFLVGDSHKDIQAGRLARVTTILLRTDYNQQVTEADHIVENLRQAAALLQEVP